MSPRGAPGQGSCRSSARWLPAQPRSDALTCELGTWHGWAPAPPAPCRGAEAPRCRVSAVRAAPEGRPAEQNWGLPAKSVRRPSGSGGAGTRRLAARAPGQPPAWAPCLQPGGQRTALGRRGGSDKELAQPRGRAALTGAWLCSDTSTASCTACLRCRRHGGCLQMRAGQPPGDQMLHQPSRQAPTLLCATAALLAMQQSCFLPLHEFPRSAEPQQVSTSQLSPPVTLLNAHFMQFAALLLYFCSCVWACCRWPTARLATSSIRGRGEPGAKQP